MLKIALVALCLSQIFYLTVRWLRVTARDHEAAHLRRMRIGLDWQGQAHRRRTGGKGARSGWIWR